jgi:tRNA (Thr-GGU) A37 N-methylase
MEHLDAVGVFSQRTKFRPNPIGVTPVRLVKIDANRLVVTGLDAMDGSPVFDIKPFIPEFDSVGEVRQPSWVSAMVKGYF